MWPSHVYAPFEDTGLWRPPSGPSSSDRTDTSADMDSGTLEDSAARSPDEVEVDVVAVRTFQCLDATLRDTLGAFEPPVTLTTQEADETADTTGAVIVDVDGDGWDDVWFAAADGGALYLFDGDAFEVARKDEFWAGSDLTNARGGAVADYDADGDLDLFVVRDQGADRLFRNDGDGRWEDVTEALFKIQDAGLSTAALWLDADGDVDLDLWVVNEDPGDTPKFYRNNNGAFDLEDARALVDDEASFQNVRQLVAMDVTGDGQAELFSWYASAPDGFAGRKWTRGEGGLWLADASAVGTVRATGAVAPVSLGGSEEPDWFAGGAMGFWGMESAAEDGVRWSNVLVERWGITDLGLDGVEVTGVYVGDLDHDGVEDVLLDRGPWSFGLDGIQRQEDALYLMGSAFPRLNESSSFGLDQETLGVGGVMADINQDGWLDVIRRNASGDNQVHLSRCGTEPSLQVRLSWHGSNRNAVGARVVVEADQGHQMRWMQSFEPAGSSAPPVVHLGMGGQTGGEQILHVTWPDGRVSASRLDAVGGLASTSYEVVVYRTD